MGEESDEVLRVIFYLARIAGKEVIAQLDAARRGIGRRLVNDHADAAEIDVAIVGDQLDGGRSDVDREVLLEHRLVALEVVPPRAIARAHAQDRSAFLYALQLRCQ